mmetsp:Transcript_7106/g.23753  ORF Transcript_7106/g.23753 Transcript_7106/m.23753 type:complete len:315 (+) Transcript_7106:180-1124(+)
MSLIKSASRSSVVTLVLALGGPDDDGVSVGGAASNCSSEGVGAGSGAGALTACCGAGSGGGSSASALANSSVGVCIDKLCAMASAIMRSSSSSVDAASMRLEPRDGVAFDAAGVAPAATGTGTGKVDAVAGRPSLRRVVNATLICSITSSILPSCCSLTNTPSSDICATCVKCARCASHTSLNSKSNISFVSSPASGSPPDSRNSSNNCAAVAAPSMVSFKSANTCRKSTDRVRSCARDKYDAVRGEPTSNLSEDSYAAFPYVDGVDDGEDASGPNALFNASFADFFNAFKCAVARCANDRPAPRNGTASYSVS